MDNNPQEDIVPSENEENIAHVDHVDDENNDNIIENEDEEEEEDDINDIEFEDDDEDDEEDDGDYDNNRQAIVNLLLQNLGMCIYSSRFFSVFTLFSHYFKLFIKKLIYLGSCTSS